METRREADWQLFTSTVLLISATAATICDEIDRLVSIRTNHDQRFDPSYLMRIRRRFAALAAIAEHYHKGDRE